MQRVLEPMVRQALGMTLAGLKQNKGLSAKEVAFVIAANFALCTGPDSITIDWSKVPSYSTEKELGVLPWFANDPFSYLLAQLAPPSADVQQYCSAILLSLLRTSTSLGSELVANKIESHTVKGEQLDIALLPSVIAALGDAHRLMAVDVALVLVNHVLPLAPSSSAKLHAMKVMFALLPCSVAPTPSDAAPEYVPLPLLLSEKLLAALVAAVQDTPDPALHLAAVHILNAVLRLPQSTYVLRLKPMDWSCLLKYCIDLVGVRMSERCVASLAIFTALRFMSCDPGAITMAKCLRWYSPTATEHAFLSNRSTWTDSHSVEFSVLTPFISGCALPQVALTFSSRMLAAACDLQAPAPSVDDASALRLPSLVCILTGYATLAHLRAPFDWMQHANGVFVFWGARCGVDVDGVLQALKDLKDACAKAHTDGVYTPNHLVPLFLHVLQHLHVSVCYAMNLQGDEAADCTVLNDAAAPVMAWACDISSLASAPAVAACVSAFASFSRQQCLDTDIINLLASLKRFGQGAGGELLHVCKEIASNLTDGGAETVDAVFPDTNAQVDADAAVDPKSRGVSDSPEDEDALGDEAVAGTDDERYSISCSPLAATPPGALHGGSPLVIEDTDHHNQTPSNFARAAPLFAAQPLPLFASTSSDLFYPNYNSSLFDEMAPHNETIADLRSDVHYDALHANVDFAFTEVVSGLNSSTAQMVKRAQYRHRERRAGRTGDEEPQAPYIYESESCDEVEGHSFMPSAPPTHTRGPSSFSFMSEAAAEENLAANKIIVERLASIESMLSKLTASSGQLLVGQSTESFLHNSHELTSHAGSASAGTPPLSARSLQSNASAMSHNTHQTADENLKPKLGRGGARGHRGSAAAEAAAKYLKSASVANDANAKHRVYLPDFASETTLNKRTSVRESTPLANNLVNLNPPQQSASRKSVSVNRESLEKAMQAMSGLRNTADLTGTTAEAVGALLKANSGNPLYAKSFDPLVIGATLEAFETFLYSVYSTDIGVDIEEEREDHTDTMKLPRVIADGMAAPGTMGGRHVLPDDADEDKAIDLPPMKDMTVPIHHRESIRMEQFLTHDLLQFLQSSDQFLDRSQLDHQQPKHQQQQQQQQHQHQQQQEEEDRHEDDWKKSESNSVASSVDVGVEDSVQSVEQDPELREYFGSVPQLSDDLDAMHEAYTTAISQLSRAMTDVRHVMKPPSSSQDESPTPSVKMWNREEEENFVLRPRQESTQSEGARRGSSWSWFVA